MEKLFAFFEEMKNENENFFFDVDVGTDDNGKKIIRNIFWSNASCQAAYADFGDCVTFDTTYKTNKYHMPLGVFVGVNNHLQSTIFGVALVGNESSDSFEWIFNAFKRCMRKDPTCILTGIASNTSKPLELSPLFSILFFNNKNNPRNDKNIVLQINALP